MKTYARGNNEAPSITKYGSPVLLDAQIVALCSLHCARTALRAPLEVKGGGVSKRHRQKAAALGRDSSALGKKGPLHLVSKALLTGQ